METTIPAGPTDSNPRAKPGSLALYVILGAGLFAFLQAFWLLSPILLSFLLILLITLAINPVISWMRGLGGSRQIPTGLVTVGLVLLMALPCWAFFGPMKTSVVALAERVPSYWERLQKPLIKMEQHAVLSEAKLQAEVRSEIVVDATAPGKPQPVPAALKPAPPKAASDSVTIRSGTWRSRPSSIM